MADYKIDEIDITSLDVDLENPRHEVAISQREALLSMIDDQKEKLLNLAEDIIKNGINPTEFPIVIPHEREKEKFIVLEGNRRVTALKFLNEESIADGIKNKSLAKRFKLLSRRFHSNPIDRLNCVIFLTREAASPWIRLRHTGENKGIGIVPWGAKEKARFEHNLGKPSLALQAISFVSDNAELDEKTKTNLDKIHITNLERLLGDKDVQKFIGFYVAKGKLYSNLQKAEILKGLVRVIKDVANKKIAVTDIYYKDQRKEYIKSFDKESSPNHGKKTPPWSFDSASPAISKTVIPTDRSQVRSRPLSTNRNTVIPSDCKFKIDDKRINAIYRELRDIEVKTFKNATAVLLRVFLELSIDHFLEKTKIPGVTNNSSLHTKFAAVSKFLEKNKLLSGSQVKPINTAISNPNSIFSIDTFHAYVHNRYFQPSPEDLNLAWDNMQIFIEKIWA